MNRKRERLSSVDMAWLRMDRPGNHMMVVGVMVTAERLSFEDVKRLVAARWLRFGRFRQRIEEDVLGPVWVEQPAFDLDLHVVRTALPGRAGQRELEALVSELASTALDPGRPLWQFHVVENFRRGSALVLRIHHCYADGIALVRVFMSMLDDRRHRQRAPEDIDGLDLPENAFEEDHSGLAWLASLYPPAADLVGRAVAQGQGLLERGLGFAAHPERAREIARSAADMVGELARLALLPSEPLTSLKGPLCGHKLATWARPLPLRRVKAVGRALDVTVNDVLMALVADVLGEHLRATGEARRGLTIRASVPVNLRRPDEPPSLGNRFGLVFVELPIGERDPVARVRRMHRGMTALKASHQPLVVLTLLSTLGMAPEPLQASAVELFSSKASLVASNVPGPQQALYLAGRRVAEEMFWVPQSGSIGVGISVLSYNKRVHFGLIADSQLIERPRRLMSRIPKALAELEQAVSQETGGL